jgi:heme exporter protein A
LIATPTMPTKSIHSFEATGLSCIRDDRILFEELDFKLVSGQILLLEGPNGSGKTSLLRILCGFREADSGEIRWCGEPVKDSQFYEQMVYVGHLDGVKKELTVLENLKMSLALSSSGHYSIDEALIKVRLEGYDDVLVQALSAGQKKRLSLARLLMTGNVLWILDEPFTSLDKQGIALIETLMIEHCANNGMIVLTSHHEIDFHDIDVQQINLG